MTHSDICAASATWGQSGRLRSSNSTSFPMRIRALVPALVTVPLARPGPVVSASSRMEKIFSWLSRQQHRLAGNKQLLPYERMCLDAWRESLADQQKATLDAQLASVDLIQWQAGGAKVCFFQVDPKPGPLFGNQEPDQHVADVNLTSSNEPSAPIMRAKLFVHRGRFFSIEFPKRPHRYMELHGMDEQSLRVAEVVSKQSLE